MFVGKKHEIIERLVEFDKLHLRQDHIPIETDSIATDEKIMMMNDMIVDSTSFLDSHQSDEERNGTQTDKTERFLTDDNLSNFRTTVVKISGFSAPISYPRLIAFLSGFGSLQQLLWNEEKCTCFAEFSSLAAAEVCLKGMKS